MAFVVGDGVADERQTLKNQLSKQRTGRLEQWLCMIQEDFANFEYTSPCA